MRAAPGASTRPSSRRSSRPSVDAGAPSLRDPFLFLVTATARPGVSAPKLEAALLDEIERMKADADHRRGAGARHAADRVELRVPDGERDGPGPRARLLGHGRRLALPHDLPGPHPCADAGSGPGGRAEVLPRRHADRRALRADARRRGARVAGPRRPPRGSRSPAGAPGRSRSLRRRSGPRSTGTSPASRWRTASPSSSRRTRRAPRSRSGRACRRGTSSTPRTSRASHP